MSSRAQLPEGTKRSIKPIAVSTLVGAIFCIGILLLLSLVVSTQNIPQAMISPMAIFAVSVGSFASGFCCARAMRANGLAYGALCGVIMCTVVLFASLIVSDGGFGIPALLKIAFMMLSSMIGGVMGVNTKHKRK